LGHVYWLSEQEAFARLGPERIGPDPLTMSPKDWALRCGSSRREIKILLLDQQRVAGIGNLYASEILHLAGVHPARRGRDLVMAEWRAVHRAATRVLRAAIRYEGSTLHDGTYRNALHHPGKYQNHHRVYQKEGAPCGQCRAARIRRTVQAQRVTFFCPRCQPLA
jgi:formamidopyrimidine-DNA glycosylase